jgi:hypothetical protein
MRDLKTQKQPTRMQQFAANLIALAASVGLDLETKSDVTFGSMPRTHRDNELARAKAKKKADAKWKRPKFSKPQLRFLRRQNPGLMEQFKAGPQG